MSTSDLSLETKRRIFKDIKEIVENPLVDHGIYYEHSEIEMNTGYALIIGPENTPYQWGNYLFRLTFPHSYPYEPIKVKYLTNDGQTRFNPNLYRSGKVCLSILNTWKGEQWDSTQTLTSVLLSLCTVLNEKPFLNEPDIKETHPDYEKYHMALEYKNFDIAIKGMLNKEYLLEELDFFHDIICENFKKNFSSIIQALDKLKNTIKPRNIEVYFYNMKLNINYKNLYTDMKQIHNKIKLN